MHLAVFSCMIKYMFIYLISKCVLGSNKSQNSSNTLFTLYFTQPILYKFVKNMMGAVGVEDGPHT